VTEVFAGYPRQLAMKTAGALIQCTQMLRRPGMKALAQRFTRGECLASSPRRLRNAKKNSHQRSA